MNSNQIIIEALREKRDRLVSNIKAIEGDIKTIDTTISSLMDKKVADKNINERNDKPLLLLDDYSKSDSIGKKIIWALKSKSRFLLISEIAEIIRDLEDPMGDIKKYVDKVRPMLLPLKKEGVIEPFQVDHQNRNTFWGSPNWIENGKIKPGYEYDDRKVIKKTKMEI